MPRYGSRLGWNLASLLALGLGAGVASQTFAADAAWKMRIPAHAELGKKPIEGTMYEFACTSGKGGALSLALILPSPDALAAFPLNDFEGPDGVGETHKLAEWSVGGAKQPARARTSISGWYGVDGDGYIFSTARESGRPSELARLAKRLVSSDQTRLRLVVKPLKGGEGIKVEAPIAGHREAIEKILAPCIAAVK